MTIAVSEHLSLTESVNVSFSPVNWSALADWTGDSFFTASTSANQTGTVVGPGYIPPPPSISVHYFPERTVHYKTWLKSSVRDGLSETFAKHPDTLLQSVKVTLDSPRSEAEYPAVVIRFYENRIERQGLFNKVYQKYLVDGIETPLVTQEQYIYWGTIEFNVIAQNSSYDRDLVSDTVVQVVLSDLETWLNSFRDRIYTVDDSIIDTRLNYINLNHGHLLGFGESNQPVPWQEEDEQLYRTIHRTEVMGQFLTPPDVPTLFIMSYSLYPFVDYSLTATINPPVDDPGGFVGSVTNPPPPFLA